ncbi:hypothetical protein [Pedobacter arcticus]|uniref:hypothetical protein n=1 Tax=Pedobacter arcticus TaxID=752140 RepID=UPI0002F3A81A|nr:hypothetical protein [Pedobacter arcticus]
MKKILLTLAVAFSLSALTVEGYSQTKAIPYYSTQTMDEINATPEQRAAVKTLVSEFKDRVSEVKAKSGLSKEEMDLEVRKLTSERAKQYWKLLTPEQTKYLKDKAKSN